MSDHHRSLESEAPTMLDDHSFDEGISSPVAVHILDFCDDGSGGDLFAPVSAAASEMFAASSSDDAASSSTTTTTAPSLCSHGSDNVSSSSSSSAAAAAATAFSVMAPSFDSTTLSALLEEEEEPPPGIDADGMLIPMEYTFVAALEKAHPKQQFAVAPVELPAVAGAEHQALQTQMSSTMSELAQLSSEYNDQCFAAALAGGFMGLEETLCQQHAGAMLSAAGGVGDPPAHLCFFDNDEAAQRGFFGDSCAGGNGMMMMPMMGIEEIGEYQRMMEGGAGAGALFGDSADSAAAQMTLANAAAAAAEMQIGESLSPARLPPATDGSGLDDATFKAARLSVEERKEKIHRYIKKRNERNFSKKIKYACRKTLADSRPRVRGRFAKNDDYCEPSSPARIGSQNPEEYESIAGVKGEEDMLDTETLARLNAMTNPYMYSHTVESWI